MEPRTLDQGDIDSLRTHVGGGNLETGRLKSLNMYAVKGSGAAASDAATGEAYGSLLRRNLRNLMTSKEGMEWAATRKSLFGKTRAPESASEPSASASSTSTSSAE